MANIKNLVQQYVNAGYKYQREIKTSEGTGYLLTHTFGSSAIYIPPNVDDIHGFVGLYPGMQDNFTSNSGVDQYKDVINQIKNGNGPDYIVFFAPNMGAVDGKPTDAFTWADTALNVAIKNGVDITNAGIVDFSYSGQTGMYAGGRIAYNHPDIEVRIVNLDAALIEAYNQGVDKYYRGETNHTSIRGNLNGNVVIVNIMPVEGTVDYEDEDSMQKYAKQLNISGHNSYLITSTAKSHGEYLKEFIRIGGLDWVVGEGELNGKTYNTPRFFNTETNEWEEFDLNSLDNPFLVRSDNDYLQEKLTEINTSVHSSCLISYLSNSIENCTTKIPSEEPKYINNILKSSRSLCDKISTELVAIGNVGNRFENVDHDLAINAESLPFKNTATKADVNDVIDYSPLQTGIDLTDDEYNKIVNELNEEFDSKTIGEIREVLVYDKDTHRMGRMTGDTSEMSEELLSKGQTSSKNDKQYVIDGKPAVGDAAKDIASGTSTIVDTNIDPANTSLLGAAVGAAGLAGATIIGTEGSEPIGTVITSDRNTTPQEDTVIVGTPPSSTVAQSPQNTVVVEKEEDEGPYPEIDAVSGAAPSTSHENNGEVRVGQPNTVVVEKKEDEDSNPIGTVVTSDRNTTPQEDTVIVGTPPSSNEVQSSQNTVVVEKEEDEGPYPEIDAVSGAAPSTSHENNGEVRVGQPDTVVVEKEEDEGPYPEIDAVSGAAPSISHENNGEVRVGTEESQTNDNIKSPSYSDYPSEGNNSGTVISNTNQETSNNSNNTQTTINNENTIDEVINNPIENEEQTPIDEVINNPIENSNEEPIIPSIDNNEIIVTPQVEDNNVKPVENKQPISNQNSRPVVTTKPSEQINLDEEIPVNDSTDNEVLLPPQEEEAIDTLPQEEVVKETPSTQEETKENDSNDLLKTLGIASAIGVGVGAAAYGTYEHLKNQTPDDDHYEYDKDEEEE